MAEPADTPLALNGSLESFVAGTHSFVVYTHASRTRLIIAALFVFYLVFFAMFTHRVAGHFREVQDLPPIFQALEAGEGNLWLGYAAAAIGLLTALAFLFYFMWALVDIWGLQVCLSPLELRIQNTITGRNMPRIMGVGRLRMEDLEAVRGAPFFTYVSGKGRTIRFSPVANVDHLIAGILSHAPHARIVE